VAGVAGVLLEKVEQDPRQRRRLLRLDEPAAEARDIGQRRPCRQLTRPAHLLVIAGQDLGGRRVRGGSSASPPAARRPRHDVFGGEPPAHPAAFDPAEVPDQAERRPPDRRDRGS
jgi:hypothetical protein